MAGRDRAAARAKGSAKGGGRRAQGKRAARAERPPGRVYVRIARPDDVRFAREASAMIRRAAKDHDIATRAPSLLREKIATGRAVLAHAAGELVGFGYFSEWESGRFVSHSGLVVDPRFRGTGLGRKLKEKLFQASLRKFPEAITMSLTTSPAVIAMNRSLGFKKVPFARMTKDPEFWKGCETCRNRAATRAQGQQCCCEGMIRLPERS